MKILTNFCLVVPDTLVFAACATIYIFQTHVNGWTCNILGTLLGHLSGHNGDAFTFRTFTVHLNYTEKSGMFNARFAGLCSPK